MTALGRSYEHPEPRYRPEPTHNAIVGATFVVAFLVCAVLGFAVGWFWSAGLLDLAMVVGRAR